MPKSMRETFGKELSYELPLKSKKDRKGVLLDVGLNTIRKKILDSEVASKQ